MRPIMLMVCLLSLLGKPLSYAQAQNWYVVIKDNAANTPVNQVNGIIGGVATLYATIFNLTGTAFSDDGTGQPAPATSLEFAGFGFTLNPGQVDIGSRFTPDTLIPGYPQVPGSGDGSTPGSSGYVVLGTFDLTGLASGAYVEDFTAGAYPTDSSSPIVFGDINDTLTLNVTSAMTVPEAGSRELAICTMICVGWLAAHCLLRENPIRIPGTDQGELFLRLYCLMKDVPTKSCVRFLRMLR